MSSKTAIYGVWVTQFRKLNKKFYFELNVLSNLILTVMYHYKKMREYEYSFLLIIGSPSRKVMAYA